MCQKSRIRCTDITGSHLSTVDLIPQSVMLYWEFPAYDSLRAFVFSPFLYYFWGSAPTLKSLILRNWFLFRVGSKQIGFMLLRMKSQWPAVSLGPEVEGIENNAPGEVQKMRSGEELVENCQQITMHAQKLGTKQNKTKA